jgi:hypothetical protein
MAAWSWSLLEKLIVLAGQEISRLESSLPHLQESASDSGIQPVSKWSHPLRLSD